MPFYYYYLSFFFFFTGDHLEVCPQGDGYTCCTRDMEIKLRELSAKEYDSLVDQSFRYVQSTFVSRTRKFDGKFATMQLGDIYFYTPRKQSLRGYSI